MTGQDMNDSTSIWSTRLLGVGSFVMDKRHRAKRLMTKAAQDSRVCRLVFISTCSSQSLHVDEVMLVVATCNDSFLDSF